MRILGLIPPVLGTLTLADPLLAPVLQTVIDPGPIRSGIQVRKLVGPSLTLAVGLGLMKRYKRARASDTCYPGRPNTP